MSIIRFEDVDVIFSKDPREALKLLDQGMTRNEILKKTGQIVGVEKATLDINKGEICVLMGLSGSGKSSLLRCINGLNTVSRLNDKHLVAGSRASAQASDLFVALELASIGHPHDFSNDLFPQIAKGLEVWSPQNHPRRGAAAHVTHGNVQHAILQIWLAGQKSGAGIGCIRSGHFKKFTC